MPLTESDLGELLTVTAAAEFYGVSRSTLYRMIENGDLDVVRFGEHGQYKITKRSLLDHLNRSVVPAKANRRRRRSA
jgi:excisionase family DNA binding protein